MKNELEKAEYFWTQLTKTDLLDQDTSKAPVDGWIKLCREALQISQADLAVRLKISQQALAKLEHNEVTGAITLKRLKHVAQEMDCEVVYYIRHKQKKNFSKLLWEKILPTALKEYKFRMRTSEIKKPMVLAKMAEELFRQPAFRRKMKWCRNTKAPNY